jgi:hypothetical protein
VPTGEIDCTSRAWFEQDCGPLSGPDRVRPNAFTGRRACGRWSVVRRAGLRWPCLWVAMITREMTRLCVFDASDRGVLIRIDPHRSATGAALPLGAALTGALWFTHITHLFQRVWASTVVVTRLGCARSAPPVLACRASRHDRSLRLRLWAQQRTEPKHRTSHTRRQENGPQAGPVICVPLLGIARSFCIGLVALMPYCLLRIH